MSSIIRVINANISQYILCYIDMYDLIATHYDGIMLLNFVIFVLHVRYQLIFKFTWNTAIIDGVMRSEGRKPFL